MSVSSVVMAASLRPTCAKNYWQSYAAAAPVEPLLRELQAEDSGRPELRESPNRVLGGSMSRSLDVFKTLICLVRDCGCRQMQYEEWRVHILQQHVQLLLSKADDLDDRLSKFGGHSQLDGENMAADLLKLIRSSQPFFNALQSSERNTDCPCLPMKVCFQPLDFSQQLCDRFEHLLLTCASYNILSTDERDLYSTPYFSIGTSQLGPQTVAAYRYCKLVPYNAHTHTGLYKRMRWNVDDTRKMKGREVVEGEAQTFIYTDYYFLCYEDMSMELPDVEGNSVGLWSIGQWVQLDPNPNPENLYDWILCEVPLATYERLLYLGTEEPSCSHAMEQMHQLLLSK